ncbi:hypothetical protein [Erysipelothrix tonsillarum]|uniref:hypothetical protein n=1 Tax=Erysipelothrix tonsillarum TaxID=38402 RepID=UPI00037DBFED|nr:hypothetical protein [Erysipelothrix tonsillarum]
MKYYIFLGISIIVVAKGLYGYKFKPLRYLKMFEMEYSFQNLLELFACAMFLIYYYIKIGSIIDADSIITLPSLIIFFYFSVFISEDG